jgi:PadR family transcriptional regulator, regulatory protein AphA
MALRYALLGLLTQRPASGYDLAKAFKGPLGRYAWYAGHNRIYPELARLTDEALIEVAEEGERRRRTYALTAKGRAELRAWLMAESGGGSAVRNERVLRLFLLPTLDGEDARRLLRELAESSAREAAELREAMAHDAPAASKSTLPFGWLAAGFGVRTYEMVQDWALWALGELDKFEEPEEGEAAESL